MTSIIAWKNNESYHPTIWIIGDTKFSYSDRSFTLSNEGSKIMLLRLRVKDMASIEHKVYYESTFGFAFAGSAFVAYSVYNLLNHFLSNIGGLEKDNDLPSMQDIALKAEKILKFYIETIQSKCEIFLSGKCPKSHDLQLFKISIELDILENFQTKTEKIDLDSSDCFLLGDFQEEIKKEVAAAKLLELEKRPNQDRAPIYALKKVINDENFPSIGGSLQLGILRPLPFGYFELMSIISKKGTGSLFSHNNIDIAEIIGEDIGLCRLGISAMYIEDI